MENEVQAAQRRTARQALRAMIHFALSRGVSKNSAHDLVDSVYACYYGEDEEEG